MLLAKALVFGQIIFSLLLSDHSQEINPVNIRHHQVEAEEIVRSLFLVCRLITFKTNCAIFSQIANTPQLFTGLALLNPNDEIADVTIEVFSSQGQLTGKTSFTLSGGHRLSKLLYELVPETRNQVEGYFLVRSSQPLAGQQIFGDYRQTFFAAVPPKILGAYALTP